MLARLRLVAKRSPLGTAVRWWKRVSGRTPVPRPLTPAEQRAADYDRDTVAILRRALAGGGNAVDVGAHEGAILREIVAASPGGRHHAFEPIPHLAAGLRAAFPGVRVHQKALADAPGTSSFLHVVNDPGYSGLRKRDYDRNRPAPVFEELAVEVVRLDDVIPAGESVAFIKIDVEGGEYHAMRGALGTVRRCRPVIVFEAALRSTGCYGVGAGDLFDLVNREMGYSLWTLRDWLAGGAPYTREGFEQNWHRRPGPEFYFVAGPAARA
jgi:FkbM family methyltransferase